MLNRNVDHSLSSFSNTIDYFTQLIQAREIAAENLKHSTRQHKAFLTNLENLKNCVIEEFNQARANNDVTTENYILNFSKKLTRLKNIVETSTNYDELNEALDELMIAAETPISIGERIACVTAGIAGAIVGAVIGSIVCTLTYGLLGAIGTAVICFPLAFLEPELYLFLIAGCGAIGALIGTVGGAMEGAKVGYETALKKMKTHHSTKIEQTTISLFKISNDPARYNSHLFFPNSKTQQLAEGKNQVPETQADKPPLLRSA